MSAQRLDGIVAARKLRLAQRGMYLAMADVVHKNDRAAFAAAQLGNQMVQALRHIRRNRPQAKRTDGQTLCRNGLGT